MQINVYEAKTQLSSLLDRAVAGEIIVIARAGEPLVRVVPIHQAVATKSGVTFGVTFDVTFGGPLAGKIRLEEDFLDPVADDQLLGVGPQGSCSTHTA